MTTTPSIGETIVALAIWTRTCCACASATCFLRRRLLHRRRLQTLARERAVGLHRGARRREVGVRGVQRLLIVVHEGRLRVDGLLRDVALREQVLIAREIVLIVVQRLLRLADGGLVGAKRINALRDR